MMTETRNKKLRGSGRDPEGQAKENRADQRDRDREEWLSFMRYLMNMNKKSGDMICTELSYPMAT